MNDKRLLVLECDKNEILYINIFNKGHMQIGFVDTNEKTDRAIQQHNLNMETGGVKIFNDTVKLIYGNIDQFTNQTSYENIKNTENISQTSNTSKNDIHHTNQIKKYAKMYKFVDETYHTAEKYM